MQRVTTRKSAKHVKFTSTKDLYIVLTEFIQSFVNLKNILLLLISKMLYLNVVEIPLKVGYIFQSLQNCSFMF